MADVAAELRKNYVDDSDQSDGYDASSESNDEHSQVRSAHLYEAQQSNRPVSEETERFLLHMPPSFQILNFLMIFATSHVPDLRIRR